MCAIYFKTKPNPRSIKREVSEAFQAIKLQYYNNDIDCFKPSQKLNLSMLKQEKHDFQSPRCHLC